MHIGIACNHFRIVGGMERHAVNLAINFQELGHRVAVICRSFDSELAARIGVVPVRLRNWVPRVWRNTFFSWRTAKAKQRLGVDFLVGCARVDSADIAICGGTHLGFMRRMGRPMRAYDRLEVALERRYYENARIVSVVSQAMAREVMDDYGVAPGKISVMPPPTDVNCFSTVPEDERRRLRVKFGFPEDRAIFLFPSFSHQIKGFDVLARLLTETRLPVTLVVAGKEVPAARNIVSLGPRADMPDLFRAADCAVLASRYEAFGLVAVESALCGTPMLAPWHIGAAEVLDDRALIRFELDDSASLEAAVASATERALAGRGRLEHPRESIAYDPSPLANARQLLDLMR
jgi:glycosyltransferase involved in cell wall biosynthesis